jgi:hypothetical protein
VGLFGCVAIQVGAGAGSRGEAASTHPPQEGASLVATRPSPHRRPRSFLLGRHRR